MGKQDRDGLRADVVRIGQAMDAAGFCPSKSGNVSARLPDGMLITPSGLPYAATTPADLVEIGFDGTVRAGRGENPRRPSSEWPFHAAIYQARPDAQAIVHTHSPKGDGARLRPSADPGLPLHGRLLRRSGHPLRGLRDVRHAGARRQRCRGARWPQGGAAGQPRRHRLGATLDGALCHRRGGGEPRRAIPGAPRRGLEPVVLDVAEMARVGEKFAGYGKVG